MRQRALTARETTIVEPEDVRAEVATGAFHGGYVNARAGQLHPALYHQALADACLTNGAQLFRCGRVTQIDRTASGFQSRVQASSGPRATPRLITIRSGQVLVATNGYVPLMGAWYRARASRRPGLFHGTENDRAGRPLFQAPF